MIERNDEARGARAIVDAQEELATLEAERDRLLAVVAYHRVPAYSESKDDAKPWSIFGFEFTLSDLVGALIAPTFAGRPAGEPQVLQRLAECEARIVKLKTAGSPSDKQRQV